MKFKKGDRVVVDARGVDITYIGTVKQVNGPWVRVKVKDNSGYIKYWNFWEGSLSKGKKNTKIARKLYPNHIVINDEWIIPC